MFWSKILYAGVCVASFLPMRASFFIQPHDMMNIVHHHQEIIGHSIEHSVGLATIYKDLIERGLERHTIESGYFIVKAISSILPHVDGIGHKVLHADNELINYIIHCDDIPHNLRAKLILLSIRIAQMGDNFGTHMLQMYFDLVNHCLQNH